MQLGRGHQLAFQTGTLCAWILSIFSYLYIYVLFFSTDVLSIYMLHSLSVVPIFHLFPLHMCEDVLTAWLQVLPLLT